MRQVFARSETLAALQAPRVPRLLDSNHAVWKTQAPLYLVMDHVPGPTVEEYVAAHAMLPLAHGLRLLRAVLTAVAGCHAGGVVHRDVKPENLLPELRGRGGDKADPRSDLTACVAVLLFALTGENPGDLRDADDRSPIERPAIAAALRALTSAQAGDVLCYVFDRAFWPDLRYRWQSPAQLLAAIDRLAVLAGATAGRDKRPLRRTDAAPPAFV